MSRSEQRRDKLRRLVRKAGAEAILMERLSLRGGYKFNHDVESMSFGFGVNFGISGFDATLDYAYNSTDFFKDINRLSLNVSF